MKKNRIICLVLSLVMVAAMCFSPSVYAASDDAPALSFPDQNSRVYAGIPFEAKVELSKAADKDINFVVVGSDNSRTQGVVPAGEKKAVVILPSPAQKDEKLTFTIESGSDFRLGKDTELAVKSYDAPTFSLYYQGTKYISFDGSYANKIVSSNKNHVVRNTSFSMRLGSADGPVVATAVLSIWGKSVSIDIKPDASWGRTATLYLTLDNTDMVCGTMEAVVGPEGGNYPVRRVDTEAKKIGISFDCAYGTTFTDYILDLLDEYNATATFFMTGGWVQSNPDYVKKIYERGHEIGNHSRTHPRMAELSDLDVIEQITTTSDWIEEIVGIRPTLFRPPYGNQNQRVATLAEYCGCETVMWTYDSHDWKEDVDADYIIRRCTKDAAAGDIVLMHNGAPLTEETLRPIFDYYTKDLGLQMVNISDLLYKGDYNVPKDGLVTAGSDYSDYTGADLFAGQPLYAEVKAGETSVELELTAEFDDTTWFMYKGDAEQVIAGTGGVDVQIALGENLSAPISAGQELGTAVFSLAGYTDITAKLLASHDVAVDEGADNTAPEELEESETEILEKEESGGCNMLFIGIGNLVIIAAVAAVLGVLAYRRKANVKK